MRRADVRTTHTNRETATQLARAVRPDNTAEMDTHVEDDVLVTTIERETTGGLQTTVDDYVVNLSVAAQLLDQQTTRTTSEQPKDQSTEQTKEQPAEQTTRTTTQQTTHHDT